MTGEIFLACFLGCLLALLVVVVLGYQFLYWRISVAIKQDLPGFIEEIAGSTLGRDALARAGVARVARVGVLPPREATATRVSPERITCVCAACGDMISVRMSNAGKERLEDMGWRQHEETSAWMCPWCDPERAAPPAIMATAPEPTLEPLMRATCACGVTVDASDSHDVEKLVNAGWRWREQDDSWVCPEHTTKHDDARKDEPRGDA